MDAKNLQERKWLVIYTRHRWEKKVDRLLKQQGIESYCPVKKVQSQWADRRKEVSLPLFSSYIFVHVNLREQSNVLYVLGVLGFVHYMGKPAVVRENVITRIKENLLVYDHVEVLNLQTISAGDRVRIKQGLLANQVGEVVQVQGKNVLMVFDSIDCALVTRVSCQNLDTHSLNQ